MSPQFFHASQDTRIRLRDKSVAAGDQVRRHHSNPDIWLVTAQTYSTATTRAWYKVNTATVTCTCKGFHARGICRHLCRVSWEVWLGKEKKKARIIQFPAPSFKPAA